jgi:hypothetical protein
LQPVVNEIVELTRFTRLFAIYSSVRDAPAALSPSPPPEGHCR